MFMIKLISKFINTRFTNGIIYLLVIAAVTVFLIIDTADDRTRLVGAGGFLVLQGLNWLLSVHPARVRWRHIFWGHSLQFIFALLVIRLA